jgi:hypothetical protein
MEFDRGNPESGVSEAGVPHQAVGMFLRRDCGDEWESGAGASSQDGVEADIGDAFQRDSLKTEIRFDGWNAMIVIGQGEEVCT